VTSGTDELALCRVIGLERALGPDHFKPWGFAMAKVPAFHTDSDDHRPEDKLVYHDNDECGYGNRIKRAGNEKDGTSTGGRRNTGRGRTGASS
jgi:hypothetical protein